MTVRKVLFTCVLLLSLLVIVLRPLSKPLFEAHAAVGAISGRVFEDTDSTGYLSAGDNDMDGVRVDLYRDINDNNHYDEADTFITSTITAGGGLYSFANVVISDSEEKTAYLVKVDSDIAPNTTVINTMANSVYIDTGVEGQYYEYQAKNPAGHLVLLSAAQPTYNLAHFGYTSNYGRSDLSGKVFQDLNSNDIFDGSDVPIQGVTVKVVWRHPFSLNSMTYYDTTDANGDYFLNDYYNGIGFEYRIIVEATEEFMPEKPIVGNPDYIFSDDGNPDPRNYMTIAPFGDPEITDYNFAMVPRSDVVGTTCSPERGIDVIFAIDQSASMSSVYQPGVTRLQAMQDVMTQIATEVLSYGSNSRIGVAGGNVSPNSFGYVNFQPNILPLSYDLTRVTDFIDGLGASGNTSIIHPLMFAADELSIGTDSVNKPVIVYLSDGVPTTTYKPNFPNGFGEALTFTGILNFDLVETIPLKDGLGAFLPIEDIATYGEGDPDYSVSVPGADPYLLSELFSDVLYRTRDVNDYVINRMPELQIHAVGMVNMSDYDDNLPDLMEYMAQLGNGEFATVDNVDDLVDSITSSIELSICSEDVPEGQVGDTVFIDENQNGIQDDGEAGIEGVEVQLYKDQNANNSLETDTDVLVEFVYTDGNGEYTFDRTNVLNRNGDGNRYFATVQPTPDNQTILEDLENLVYSGSELSPANYSRDIEGYEINLNEENNINDNADFGFVLGETDDEDPDPDPEDPDTDPEDPPTGEPSDDGEDENDAGTGENQENGSGQGSGNGLSNSGADLRMVVIGAGMLLTLTGLKFRKRFWKS